MPFKGGPKAAAELLARLPALGRKKVMELIKKRDPVMAETLRKNMVTLDDLRFLTVKMLAELMKEIKPEELGLALRLAQPETCEHILDNVSKRLRAEIEDVMNGPPVKASKAQEAEGKILDLVREKVEKGTLVLRADDKTV